MTDDDLQLWTIYDRPAGHPNRVVVRGYVVRVDDPRRGYGETDSAARAEATAHILASDVLVCSTVEQARQWLAGERPGLVCTPRDPEDEPAVVETWHSLRPGDVSVLRRLTARLLGMVADLGELLQSFPDEGIR